MLRAAAGEGRWGRGLGLSGIWEAFEKAHLDCLSHAACLAGQNMEQLGFCWFYTTLSVSHLSQNSPQFHFLLYLPLGPDTNSPLGFVRASPARCILECSPGLRCFLCQLQSCLLQRPPLSSPAQKGCSLSVLMPTMSLHKCFLHLALAVFLGFYSIVCFPLEVAR